MPSRRGRARTGTVVLTLALCGTVVSLQQTVVLPMLPAFPSLLSASVDDVSWLVTATLLAGCVATPTVSRLADMHGKKRMVVATLAVMVIGSLLGAVSTDLPWVVAARALQGVGMALIPVGIAAMRDELPRDKVPLGVAIMSATLAVGGGAGPVVGGLVLEHLEWHAVFLVTGALGALMLVAALLLLGESPVRTGGRFDVVGAVLLSAALTAGLLALSKGGLWGWTSARTLVATAVAVLLLTVWVPFELRVPQPLVDLRVSARRTVVLVNAASVFAGFAMFINMLVTTQQLQLPVGGAGLGLGVLAAGLWMAPSAVVFGAMAPVAAWLVRRAGPATTLASGALLMSATYAARLVLDDGLAPLVTASVVVAAGTSLTYAAMPTLVMRAVPVTEAASANGLNTLMRSVGTTASSATVAAVTAASVVRVDGAIHPGPAAVHTTLQLAVVASLVTAVLAVLLRGGRRSEARPRSGPDPAAGMVIHGRILTAAGPPPRSAVVTFLSTSGEEVDWGQADTTGAFSVAVPGPGRYVVVATADGWAPSSQIADVDAGCLAAVVLDQRLTISGRVLQDLQPVPDALVVLTGRTGAVLGTVPTGCDGEYDLTAPPPGSYVLTAVSPSGRTRSCAVVVRTTPLVVDLVLTAVPSRDRRGVPGTAADAVIPRAARSRVPAREAGILPPATREPPSR